MRPQEHRSLRELLGAFVLDQLTPVERSVVADHLTGCDSCRADVAELEPTARLLRGARSAGPAAAPAGPAAAPPGDLADRILAETRRTGRPTRRGGTGPAVRVLAVAAAVAAAFVLGSQLGLPPRPGAPSAGTTMAPTAGSTGIVDPPPVEDLDVQAVAAGVAGTAGLVTHTWGTEVKLEAAGLAEGATYQVSIVSEDGTVVAAGTFLGTGDAAVRCSLNAALPRDSAATVQVTDAAGLIVLAADAG